MSVVSFGRDKSGLFAPAVDAYANRLSHYTKLELLELPAATSTGFRAKQDEAATLKARLKGKSALVAMDERGKAFTSVELATWLGKRLHLGTDLAFIIGGDEGLDESLRQEAVLTLALSSLTLPHRMARMVLVEQLYRAFTLLKGEPYHK